MGPDGDQVKVAHPSHPPHRRPGILKRLASRVGSTGEARPHDSADDGHVLGEFNHQGHPSTVPDESHHDHKPQDASLYERARSHTPSFRAPSFRPGHRAVTSNSSSSPPHSKKGSSSTNRRLSPAAALSQELWDEAYDGLRLDPSSMSLVVTYESIVAQELPDDLRASRTGSTISSTDGDTDRRMSLMAAIATSVIARRRGSKASQVDDVSRVIPACSKRALATQLDEYPSAALAWSGFCSLTPLLIDPILRHEDFRRGMVHVIGRISWYMYLVNLLLPASRQKSQDRRDLARDEIVRLYRRVLELEMNCVCAAASAWNQVARHAVRWSTIGQLVDQVCEGDTRLRELVNDIITEEAPRHEFLLRDADLDIDMLEREWQAQEEGGQGAP